MVTGGVGFFNMNDKMESLNSALSPHYMKVAEYAFPSGTKAYCPKCRASRHAATSELAEWFQKGYPVCKCGGKITIETPRDKAVR